LVRPFVCAGIFCGSVGDFLGWFTAFISNAYAIRVELMGTIFVIESGMDRGWSNLWLETDSILVTRAFVNHNIWDIRNKWRRCLDKIRHMHFKITHIFTVEFFWLSHLCLACSFDFFLQTDLIRQNLNLIKN